MRYNEASYQEEIEGLEKAIAKWEQVLQQCPSSYEARIATQKLQKELNQEKAARQ